MSLLVSGVQSRFRAIPRRFSAATARTDKRKGVGMLRLREFSLGEVDPRIQWKTLRLSPDGQRAAYVVGDRRPGGAEVMPWETGEPDVLGMVERKLQGQERAAVVVDGA